MDVLLDEVIRRKDVLFGEGATGIKKDVWINITQALATACPQAQVKDLAQTKKKYQNLKREAMDDIKKFNDSIRGTGDGPKFYLKPLYEKFMLGIIGRDNIAWPQGKAVEGGYDTTAESPNASHYLEDGDEPETILKVVEELPTPVAVVTTPSSGAKRICRQQTTAGRGAQNELNVNISEGRLNNENELIKRKIRKADVEQLIAEEQLKREKLITAHMKVEQQMKLFHDFFKLRKETGFPMTKDEIAQEMTIIREMLSRFSTF